MNDNPRRAIRLPIIITKEHIIITDCQLLSESFNLFRFVFTLLNAFLVRWFRLVKRNINSSIRFQHFDGKLGMIIWDIVWCSDICVQSNNTVESLPVYMISWIFILQYFIIISFCWTWSLHYQVVEKNQLVFPKLEDNWILMWYVAFDWR